MYRFLIRLAVVAAILPLVGLVLAMTMSPDLSHMHMPDAAGFVLVFGPAAAIAALAWIVKPPSERR
jgi:hypothetical protein